jgi:Domain of unknown function (DUF222)
MTHIHSEGVAKMSEAEPTQAVPSLSAPSGPPSPVAPTPYSAQTTTTPAALAGLDIDALAAADDFDFDAYTAWCIGEEEAGRERVPALSQLEGPAVSVSLGDAADIDPGLLAALCGPDGLGGESLSAALGQDKAADVLRPGPVLSALTEQAAESLGDLTDNQLSGALAAARRLQNRAAYLQTIVIAQFARRRAVEREEARSRKVPKAWRPGEYPDEELAMELVATANHAAARICEATDLTTRLPRTLAAMADGAIDAYRASIIYSYTFSLSPADAARADEILAPLAPGLRYDQLAAKAAALEMKLDPEAVARRKALARRDGQRVETRREHSGNASVAGREMDTATALAIKANVDAIAARLRNGNHEGTLQRLRYLAFTELLQGRNPLDRLSQGSGSPAPASSTASPVHSPHDPRPPQDPDWQNTDWQDDPGYRDYENDNDFDNDRDFDNSGDDGNEHDSAAQREFAVDPAFGDADREESSAPFRRRSGPGTPAGGLAPMPALINLVVPVGTYLGWSTAPAQAGGWGLLDARETRDVLQAASRHPRTRWCFTVVGADGTAIAHACARGQYPWRPPEPVVSPSPAATTGPPGPPDTHDADAAPAAQLAELFRRMRVTFAPIAKDSCDHHDAEDRYIPSRKLKHLVRARTTTCTAPGCTAQAIHCDLDHTIPYPDGLSCQCNVAPKCRRHHQVKQAPGWHVDQPQPGIIRWTLPSGRTYTTTPTVYDV